MKQAINAYHQITVTPEFREAERLRSIARHNEASALSRARDEERKQVDAKWQNVVAKKDTVIADKNAENEQLRSQITELQSKLKKLG